MLWLQLHAVCGRSTERVSARCGAEALVRSVQRAKGRNMQRQAAMVSTTFGQPHGPALQSVGFGAPLHSRFALVWLGLAQLGLV